MDLIGSAACQHTKFLKAVINSELPLENEDLLKKLYNVYKEKGKLPTVEAISRIFDVKIDVVTEEDLPLAWLELKELGRDWFNERVLDCKDEAEITALKKICFKDYSSTVENIEVISSAADIMRELDDVFSKEDTITTGFHNIDLALAGGWIAGENYCIVAPSGVGKSIWLTNIARTHLAKGDTVLYFTTEMSVKQTKQRLYKSWANKSDKDEIGVFVQKNTGTALNLVCVKVEPGTTTVDDIEETIKEGGWKPNIIIIDYMDELKATEKTPNEYEKYKILGTDLKRLAERFDCPLVTASQTNRSASENGATKSFVGLESIGDSWNKVKAMSGIFTVVQDEPMQRDKDGIGYFKLCLQKSRYSGKMDTYFKINYNTMRIVDYDESTYENDRNREINNKKKNENTWKPSTFKEDQTSKAHDAGFMTDPDEVIRGLADYKKKRV